MAWTSRPSQFRCRRRSFAPGRTQVLWELQTTSRAAEEQLEFLKKNNRSCLILHPPRRTPLPRLASSRVLPHRPRRLRVRCPSPFPSPMPCRRMRSRGRRAGTRQTSSSSPALIVFKVTTFIIPLVALSGTLLTALILLGIASGSRISSRSRRAPPPPVGRDSPCTSGIGLGLVGVDTLLILSGTSRSLAKSGAEDGPGAYRGPWPVRLAGRLVDHRRAVRRARHGPARAARGSVRGESRPALG